MKVGVYHDLHCELPNGCWCADRELTALGWAAGKVLTAPGKLDRARWDEIQARKQVLLECLLKAKV